MNEPNEILPGLWIGNEHTSHDANFFKRNNIKRCVNMTPDIPCLFPWVQYMRVSVGDSTSIANQKIMEEAIPIVIPFIGKPNRSSAVLVHCQMGVSRSATMVAAYLRHCCCSSIQQALHLILSKRPVAFFGGKYVNFMKALIDVYGV